MPELETTPASRSAIEQDQLHRLRELLAALRRSNAFYRPILESAKLDGNVPDLAAFTSRCPLTTKHQIASDQLRHPPFGTNLTEPLSHYTRFHQTSGTTAAPIRWLDTNETWARHIDAWRIVLASAGITPADRIVFTFSFGPFIGFWIAFEAASRIGCLCIPAGGLSTGARLELILDNHATAICCTPTYALRLAEVAQKQGVSLNRSPLRTIIVAGEPGGSIPAVRQRIKSAWPNAVVHDHHGMTETGPVTFQQPGKSGLLRVIESHYLAEVLDPTDGSPTPRGQVGELVLTTLQRIASPVLRYRTGDLVRPVHVHDDGSPGGPHLAFDGGILARADDMLSIRGVNVYPAAVEQIIRSLPAIAEFRATVDTHAALHDLRIEIEPSADQPADPTLAARLQQLFRDHLNLRIPVTAVAPGTLPRFEMKARRWVRNS